MSRVREALVLLAVFALLLGGLFLYTKTWPPAVIVESGSMMHRDEEVAYGRFGTIDPGDLVLVKRVEELADVSTLVEGGRDRYGDPGEVVVFYPGNDRALTPIIHRAVAYVEPIAGGYDVRWSADAPCEGGATKVSRDGRAWCRYGPNGISIPSVPVTGIGGSTHYRPGSAGLLTKGDNPVTNRAIDQHTLPGVTRPIPIEWLEGTARGELPWLGLLKLSLAGKPNQADPPPAWKQIGWASAPVDLWVMLGVTLVAFVGLPLVFDAHRAWRERRKRGD